MKLSGIKEAGISAAQVASGAAHAVAGRAQANWKNMSTPAKVAMIGSSVVLTGAAIAAFATHSLLVSAVAGLSAKIVFAVAGGTAGLGMIVPAVALLRKPSEAPRAVEIELQKVEAAVGPSQDESVAEAAAPVVVEKPVVAGPSRLKKALAVSALAIGTMALAYYGMGVEGRASLRKDLISARQDLRDMTALTDIALIYGSAFGTAAKGAILNTKDAILHTSAAQKKEAILNGLKQVKGFFPIRNVGPSDFNPLH